MIKYWADKWVEALRSGEYGQTNGRLFRSEEGNACSDKDCETCKASPAGYCCLGVLTEVVRREMPNVGEWNEDRFSTPDDKFGYSDFTPLVIQRITDMGNSDPNLYKDDEGEPITCSLANDVHGKTFAEIADYVEANYKDM